VHPSDKNDVHELFLMCDNVDAFVSDMQRQHIACGPVQDQAWGLLAHVVLPGGGKLGVYQPRHARPDTTAQGPPATKYARRATKTPTKKARRQLKSPS
jgi:hypothetical protein